MDTHPLLSSLPPSHRPTRARLTFLYSHLRPRRVANPTGYHSALAWWGTSFALLVSQHLLGDGALTLQLDGEGWNERWRVDGIGAPLGLGGVLDDLIASKTLVPVSTFLSPSSPPKSSLISFVLSYLPSLSLSSRPSDKDPPIPSGSFVLPSLVRTALSRVGPKLDALHAAGTAGERLYTVESLRVRLEGLEGEKEWSREDTDVLVALMRTEGRCAVKGEVIKFPVPTTLCSPSSPLTITESDVALLTLSLTAHELSLSIASLSVQITSQQKKAVELLREGKKDRARKELERRRGLERVLEEREAKREKIDALRRAIESASDTASMMATIQLGTAALQFLLSTPSLSLDSVEHTMEAMREVLDASSEVDAAIRDGGVSAGTDDELTEELRELVLEEEKEAAARRKEGQDEAQAKKEKQANEEERVEEEERVRKEEERLASTAKAPPPTNVTPVEDRRPEKMLASRELAPV